MPITSPGCHLCFWLTGCKSEVPTTPSWVQLICESSSQNSENRSLTRSLVHYEGYWGYKRTARCTSTQVWKGLGHRSSVPVESGVHRGVLQHVEMFLFTNRQLSKPVLSGLCGGFLTWAWLHHRLLVISLPSHPSPLPERGWQGGAEIPTLIHGWFSWQPAPILSGFPQVTSLTQTQVWWKGLGMNNRTCLSTLLLWTYFRKWRKRGQMA